VCREGRGAAWPERHLLEGTGATSASGRRSIECVVRLLMAGGSTKDVRWMSD
jgi:hypothetical protein